MALLANSVRTISATLTAARMANEACIPSMVAMFTGSLSPATRDTTPMTTDIPRAPATVLRELISAVASGRWTASTLLTPHVVIGITMHPDIPMTDPRRTGMTMLASTPTTDIPAHAARQNAMLTIMGLRIPWESYILPAIGDMIAQKRALGRMKSPDIAGSYP